MFVGYVSSKYSWTWPMFMLTHLEKESKFRKHFMNTKSREKSGNKSAVENDPRAG